MCILRIIILEILLRIMKRKEESGPVERVGDHLGGGTGVFITYSNRICTKQ